MPMAGPRGMFGVLSGPQPCSPLSLREKGTQFHRHLGYLTTFSAKIIEQFCTLADQVTYNGKKPTNPSQTWSSHGQPSK